MKITPAKDGTIRIDGSTLRHLWVLCWRDWSQMMTELTRRRKAEQLLLPQMPARPALAKFTDKARVLAWALSSYADADCGGIEVSETTLGLLIDASSKNTVVEVKNTLVSHGLLTKVTKRGVPGRGQRLALAFTYEFIAARGLYSPDEIQQILDIIPAQSVGKVTPRPVKARTTSPNAMGEVQPVDNGNFTQRDEPTSPNALGDNRVTTHPATRRPEGQAASVAGEDPVLPLGLDLTDQDDPRPAPDWAQPVTSNVVPMPARRDPQHRGRHLCRGYARPCGTWTHDTLCPDCAAAERAARLADATLEAIEAAVAAELAKGEERGRSAPAPDEERG